MSTSLGTVAALNPTSGEVVCSIPPQQDAGGPARGLSYWTDGKDERIIAISGRFRRTEREDRPALPLTSE
jgi:hypothetical protein